MKKILLTLTAALALSSCVTYTKGADGKPGQPGKQGKSVTMTDESFKILKQESYGGWENKGNVIIKSQSALNSLYKEINSAEDTPQVDFTKNQVVALFMGQKNTGGYSIGIESLKINGTTSEIKIKETKPDGGIVTTALTNPYCIAVIAKTEHVKFIE